MTHFLTHPTACRVARLESIAVALVREDVEVVSEAMHVTRALVDVKPISLQDILGDDACKNMVIENQDV